MMGDLWKGKKIYGQRSHQNEMKERNIGWQRHKDEERQCEESEIYILEDQREEEICGRGKRYAVRDLTGTK